MSSRYEIIRGVSQSKRTSSLFTRKGPVITVEIESENHKYNLFLKGYSLSGKFIQLSLKPKKFEKYPPIDPKSEIRTVTIQRGARFVFTPVAHHGQLFVEEVLYKFQTTGFDEAVMIAKFIEGKVRIDE